MRKEYDVSLARRTTLGLGGTCAAEIVLESWEDVENLQNELDSLGLPVFVLGAGSNILAMDGRHDLVLLRAALKEAPQIVREDGDRVLVRVPAGTPLPQLLAFCRREGLSGLEGLAGIPGNVGGAVAMNAGSFGCCVGDCLVSVDIWADNRPVHLERQDFDLAYRVFRPKQAGRWKVWCVLGADLAFAKCDAGLVAERLVANHARKKERQPVGARSAGCVFKNPDKGPTAGVLLEQAGFRGRRLGGVAFSEKHANFLVNLGTGKTDEALELIGAAREAVRVQSGVNLALEVKTLPCRSF